MKNTSFVLSLVVVAFSATSCVEPESSSGLSSNAAQGATRHSSTPQPKLNKHDVALRFLTAYIRLDKKMALQFATSEAVAKLDWGRSHSGDIPYYDDKMLLHFRGGWARVYFQEINGSYLIQDLEVHRKR